MRKTTSSNPNHRPNWIQKGKARHDRTVKKALTAVEKMVTFQPETESYNPTTKATQTTMNDLPATVTNPGDVSTGNSLFGFRLGRPRKTEEAPKALEGQALLSKSKELSKWPIITQKDADAVSAYMLSGQALSISDPMKGVLGDFQDKFKATLGLEHEFAIPFNTGTNALGAAYRALGVREGDTVAVAGYTFHATGSPAAGLKAKIALIDGEPATGNVNAEIVEKALQAEPKPKVLAVNHNWGLPIRDIAEIRKLCDQHGVKLIEDCSHAHGAKVDGVAVGNFGHVAVFSTQNNKIVPTGEGGMLLTNDSLVNSRALQNHFYRAKGAYKDQHVPSKSWRETGAGHGKMRMPPEQAVKGLVQLERFEEVQGQRKHAYDRLAEGLRGIDCLEIYEPPEGVEHAVYGIRVKYHPEKNGGVSAEEFSDRLNALGVDVHVGTSIPLSQQELYNRPNVRVKGQEKLPGIDAYAENRIVFPVMAGPQKETEAVVDAWLNFIQKTLEPAE